MSMGQSSLGCLGAGDEEDTFDNSIYVDIENEIVVSI